MEEKSEGEKIFQYREKQLKFKLNDFMQKYQVEVTKRKELYNQIQDLKGQIRVFCRVRPINEREKSINSLQVVNIPD